jgi:hypothetical protein
MSDNSDQGQVVVEHIDRLMREHMPVYDTNNEKIGEVRQFDLTAGYMQVPHRRLDPEIFYIPFHLIASIDANDVYLKVSEETLSIDYTVLPESQVVLSRWTNWRTGQTETTVEHQIRSGYDGQHVAAFQQTYSMLAGELIAGMRVRDIEGTHLGSLHQFNSRQGWMLVVKAGPATDILVVPFSVVGTVDPVSSNIDLLVTVDSLRRDLSLILPSAASGDTSQAHADA